MRAKKCFSFYDGYEVRYAIRHFLYSILLHIFTNHIW